MPESIHSHKSDLNLNVVEFLNINVYPEMEWFINEFPQPTDEDLSIIASWLDEHAALMSQAQADANDYLWGAVLGDLNAVYYYSQAISTIETLQDEFRDLRYTDLVGDLNGGLHEFVLNPYIAEFSHLSTFIKTGWGIAGDGNTTTSISSDWDFYTLYYQGGEDAINVQEDVIILYVNLGNGDDLFSGNNGYEAVFGGAGDDTISGGASLDTLDGGLGNDVIEGGFSYDLIYGDAGDDIMNGGNQDDFIDGGDGANDISIYTGRYIEYSLRFNEIGLLEVDDLVADRDGIDTLVNVEVLVFEDADVIVREIPGFPNSAPESINLTSFSFDENIQAGSYIATLSSIDPDDADSHSYAFMAGVGDNDNNSFSIYGDELRIIESPDYETKSSYSIRLQATDSGGLTVEQAFTLTVNDLAEGPQDIDGDGFVDEITNYQMWTASGGVDLTNRRGRTYSDSTSRKWDAIKAVEVDNEFSVLVEGHLSKEGKYKVVTANEEGVIGGTTRWLNGNQMLDSGYEEVFSMDFNGNGVVDLV